MVTTLPDWMNRQPKMGVSCAQKLWTGDTISVHRRHNEQIDAKEEKKTLHKDFEHNGAVIGRVKISKLSLKFSLRKYREHNGAGEESCSWNTKEGKKNIYIPPV